MHGWIRFGNGWGWQGLIRKYILDWRRLAANEIQSETCTPKKIPCTRVQGINYFA